MNVNRLLEANGPFGWWIWTSPNQVDHLVMASGNCATCGRSHKKGDAE